MSFNHANQQSIENSESLECSTQRLLKVANKKSKSFHRKSQEPQEFRALSRDPDRDTHTQKNKARCAEREGNRGVDQEETEDIFRN